MFLKKLFEYMIKAKHITRIAYKQQPEKGEKGDRGAIRRVSEWVSGTKYYSGADGEPYQDVVIFNGVYYLCEKTNNSTATPYQLVGLGADLWSVATDYKFVCTKGLFIGTGAQGWIADEGRIYHTSGKIELSADGSIKTSNGNFKVDADGNVLAMNGTFEGVIKANILYNKVSLYTVTTGANIALPDDVGQIVIARLLGATGTAGGITLPKASAVKGQVIDIFCFMASNMGCYLYPKGGDSLVKYDYSTDVAGCDIRYKLTRVYSDGTRWLRLVYVDSF